MCVGRGLGYMALVIDEEGREEQNARLSARGEISKRRGIDRNDELLYEQPG
jgi:hypothetical protein